METCQIRSTQGGGFEDDRAVDGGAEDVGEELHGVVGGDHAAVDAQHCFAHVRPVAAHGFKEVAGLVADRFEGGF